MCFGGLCAKRALLSGDYHADELPEIAIDPALLAMLGALGLKVGENEADYNP